MRNLHPEELKQVHGGGRPAHGKGKGASSHHQKKQSRHSQHNKHSNHKMSAHSKHAPHAR